MQDEILADIDYFLGENSPLKGDISSFDFRKEQLQMALAFAKSALKGNHTCIEAPTGIGKSFAYLISSLVLKKHLKFIEPIVISTQTIALQEQLIEKDLEVLKKYFTFSSCLAKGRGNYLCMRKLNKAYNKDDSVVLSDEFSSEVDKVFVWSKNAKEGSFQELDFTIDRRSWSLVNSEENNCLNQQCKFFKPCFFQKSRRRVFEVDVIVCNHALLFSDLSIKAANFDSILPYYGLLIIDEAHSLEDIACRQFGVRLSLGSLLSILNRLYNSYTKKGLLKSYAKSHKLIESLKESSKRYFATIYQWALSQEMPLVYQEANQVPFLIKDDLQELKSLLQEILKEDSNLDMLVELRSLLKRLELFIEEMEFFLLKKDDKYVYFFEEKIGNFNQLYLMALPLHVAEVLSEVLFLKDFPIMLTSATLALDDSLQYFASRIGLNNFDSLILKSIFSYKRQVTISVIADLPNPNSREYLNEAIVYLKEAIFRHKGKALVLFTSYKMMKDAFLLMQDFFKENNIDCFCQGLVANKELLIEFRNNINSCLFATESFWTGVDIKGKSLSLLVIMKLPFAMPNDPLKQARMNLLQQKNKNSFFEYSLPEAILKFRQGCGRLIRSKDDSGEILLLDSRLQSKDYGVKFLESLK